jgi:hypothetical protein
MSRHEASDGQPGNWEEPGFFLHRLETVRFQENGWQEPYESRGSRTVLRGTGGEIPPVYPTLTSRQFCDIRQMSQLSRGYERTKKLMITTLFLNLFLKSGI